MKKTIASLVAVLFLAKGFSVPTFDTTEFIDEPRESFVYSSVASQFIIPSAGIGFRPVLSDKWSLDLSVNLGIIPIKAGYLPTRGKPIVHSQALALFYPTCQGIYLGAGVGLNTLFGKQSTLLNALETRQRPIDYVQALGRIAIGYELTTLNDNIIFFQLSGPTPTFTMGFAF